MSEESRPEVKRPRHRKVCQFCKDKMSHIDYKDSNRLRRFVNDRGKIIGRRTTGTCAGHQKTSSDEKEGAQRNQSIENEAQKERQGMRLVGFAQACRPRRDNGRQKQHNGQPGKARKPSEP